ncbi:hypothetical protein D3C79_656410 [compost metagenome]
MGGFDDKREAQFRTGLQTIAFARQHRVARGRNTQALPHLLGAQLVHGQCRGKDATAGVGDAQALEQALHAAVFTATAVEDDEGAVDLLALQAVEQVVTHVDGDHVDTGGGQRVDHCGTGLERHFALGALAAVQHRDAAERLDVQGRVQLVVGAGHFDFSCLAPANSGLFIN